MHFTDWEFRCRCARHNEGPFPTMDPRLITGLEELRALVSADVGVDTAIIVTSGWRCAEHNAETPGAAKGSQHLYYRAADIVAPPLTAQRLYTLAHSVKVFMDGGIGLYRNTGRIHVDVRLDGPARWSV